MSKLKDLSGAQWDEETSSIILELEHLRGHILVSIVHFLTVSLFNIVHFLTVKHKQL